MIKKLFEIQTPYHHIKIIDDYPIRKMIFGDGLCKEQSAINLLSPYNHVFDYSRLSLCVLFFVYNPIDILILGLGGGIIPMQFLSMFPEVNMDILEIDPEVLELSKKYFNFKDDKAKVHIGDAFQTISQMNKKYDIVISDIFTTSYIPYHIMSEEFLKKVCNVLKDQGVMAVNTCNIHPSFESYVKTVYGVFGDNLYREDGPNNKNCSMIFAARGFPVTDKLQKIVMNQKILTSKILTMKNISSV